MSSTNFNRATVSNVPAHVSEAPTEPATRVISNPGSEATISDDAGTAILRAPLPWWNAKRYAYAAVRGLLRSVGQLSQGIRLGLLAGFDSGTTLDYVYANEARGCTVIGRLIDRAYLDSAGWRGIRERRVNLRRLLTAAVHSQLAQGRDVHVLDVASGPGRYLQDVLIDIDDPRLRATCRDWDTRGLDEGRRLAAERGIERVRYERGDAFDPGSLGAVAPRPTIAVVSGLYELFSDNDAVLRSLRGLHAVLEDGDTLIYTNQPTHPQLELIARTLTNRNGEPWVMRLRSQQEMDDLVRSAGFEPHESAIDDAGIFSVTVASRRPR